jgi:hypothetical protein
MANPAVGWVACLRRKSERRLWRASLRSGIERATDLMPWIIADSVLQEAGWYLGVELPSQWSEWLDERAEHCYAKSSHFRSLLRRQGNLGRDTLYRFFRHWLVGRLRREQPALFRRLPVEYGLGLPLRQCSSSGRVGPECSWGGGKTRLRGPHNSHRSPRTRT